MEVRQTQIGHVFMLCRGTECSKFWQTGPWPWTWPWTWPWAGHSLPATVTQDTYETVSFP